MNGVGVQLIAAYLGVTRARVQQIINDNHIEPVGQMWKQHMYDPQEVIRHAGAHDRRAAGKQS